MKKHTHSNQLSTNPFTAGFLLLITLSISLTACGSIIQPPLPAPSGQSQATQPMTSFAATEVATQIPTPEANPALETIPLDLNFMDGRNVKEMVSSVAMDPNTGLEVALDSEGNIVAYNMKTKFEIC